MTCPPLLFAPPIRRAPPPAVRAGRAPSPCVCARPTRWALPPSTLLRRLMTCPPHRRAPPPAARAGRAPL
eukprot:6533042-Prymnesium_polylepis.1